MLSLTVYTRSREIASVERMPDRALLVFAHADEAEAFTGAGVAHLVTGVGKINATLALTEALLAARDDARPFQGVVVLGTAGAVADSVRLDTVYQIEAVVQHDYSLPSPRLEPSGALIVPERAVIATGDVFVQDDAHRVAVAALGARLVDMESYAYAAVCERLGVPLQIFKAPSDFADSSTTQSEWDGIAGSKSSQLLQFARRHLPELVG